MGARSGMTLMEMVVSLAAGSLIVGVAVILFIFSARTYVSLGVYDDFNRKSRNALDVMTADIRQSKHLTGYVSNSVLQQLVFTNMPGAAVSGFSYTYTNSTGTLSRSWGAQNKILLTNLITLSFSLSQRNPATNFTFVATSDPTVTKLINVTWICSRQVSGTVAIDSEDIQTAKIVVRN
jgi:prepilin-type N-terminal cleavage/methylation domain-containing protein